MYQCRLQDNYSVATDTNAVADTFADTDNSVVDEIPSTDTSAPKLITLIPTLVSSSYNALPTTAYYEGTKNEVSAQLLSSD